MFSCEIKYILRLFKSRIELVNTVYREHAACYIVLYLMIQDTVVETDREMPDQPFQYCQYFWFIY